MNDENLMFMACIWFLFVGTIFGYIHLAHDTFYFGFMTIIFMSMAIILMSIDLITDKLSQKR